MCHRPITRFFFVLCAMIQELKSPTGRVFLTIETDTFNRWILVDWIGYLTAANFYAQLTAFQAEVFDNLSSARAWLCQYAKG